MRKVFRSLVNQQIFNKFRCNITTFQQITTSKDYEKDYKYKLKSKIEQPQENNLTMENDDIVQITNKMLNSLQKQHTFNLKQSDLYTYQKEAEKLKLYQFNHGLLILYLKTGKIDFYKHIQNNHIYLKKCIQTILSTENRQTLMNDIKMQIQLLQLINTYVFTQQNDHELNKFRYIHRNTYQSIENQNKTENDYIQFLIVQNIKYFERCRIARESNIYEPEFFILMKNIQFEIFSKLNLIEEFEGYIERRAQYFTNNEYYLKFINENIHALLNLVHDQLLSINRKQIQTKQQFQYDEKLFQFYRNFIIVFDHFSNVVNYGFPIYIVIIKFINMLSEIFQSHQQIIQDDSSMLILSSLDGIQNKLDLLKTDQIQQILYIMTNLELYKLSYHKFVNFHSMIIQIFLKNQNQYNNLQKSSVMYNLGKLCFVNQDIQDYFLKELEIENLKNIISQENSKTAFKFVKNIFMSASNLKIIKKQDADQYHEIIKILQDKYFNQQALFVEQFLFHLGNSYFRMEYFKYEFWEIYFQNMIQYISKIENNDKMIYYVHFIFQIYTLFKDQMDKKTFELFQQYKTSFQPFLKDKDMEYYRQILLEKQGQVTDSPYSNFENYAKIILDQLGFKYEGQVCINDAFIVDYVIKDVKVVIEIQGPLHMLQSISVNGESQFIGWNLLTEFRKKCLIKLGYKVIEIHYSSENKNEISKQREFLQKLKEIKSDIFDQ